MDNNQPDFERFLSRLEPDFSTSEKRYKQLRLKLMKFFSWRWCEEPDSLADETIIRIVKNIIAGEEIRVANPYSYVYGVAMNVFREYLRDKKKRQEIASNFEVLSPDDSEDVRDCRMQCLQSLPPNKLNLLKQYYLSKENREELAASMKLSLNALRLQIHRIKNDLRFCYKECLDLFSGMRN
jgi:DNA-directed RNA polymerase specialized sigma24 family protein